MTVKMPSKRPPSMLSVVRGSAVAFAGSEKVTLGVSEVNIAEAWANGGSPTLSIKHEVMAAVIFPPRHA